MIQHIYLDEWRHIVPWSDDGMIEQDLVISRLKLTPASTFQYMGGRKENLRLNHDGLLAKLLYYAINLTS